MTSSFPSYPPRPPDGPASVPAKPSKKSRTLMWVLIGSAALLVLLCAIGVTLLVLLNKDDPKPLAPRAPGINSPAVAGPSFTAADAERECYTAFSAEFETRDAARDNQDFIATVTSIDVLDSRKVDESYVVNGTVHYSLVGAGVSTLNDTLELTCTASTLTTGQILTSVENRI